MRTRLLTILAIAMALLSSCDKFGGSDNNAKVTFRKANIAGSNMLALAQSGASTKAEGDVTVGPKALYTVSEDGTMVQVSYDIDVEGVNGEVAETIKAELIICPNFIFPVGEGWIWLANCHMDVKEGWSNGTIPQGSARSALSKIINGFSEEYHHRHHQSRRPLPYPKERRRPVRVDIGGGRSQRDGRRLQAAHLPERLVPPAGQGPVCEDRWLEL